MSGSTAIRPTPAWLYRLRRLFRVRHVTLDGLWMIAYRHDIPKHVSQMLVRGDYEMPERRAVSELLRKEDRVLEIGSCIGFVAMTAAKIVGAQNVLSFEPNAAAASIARENFALNGLPIELVNAAVGADDGSLKLRIGHDSWLGASGRRQFEGRTVEMPMRSVGRIIRDFRPTVLVIDTEGMEEELLNACPLADVRAIVVEVHPDVIGSDGIERLAHHLGENGFVSIEHLSSADTQAWQRATAEPHGSVPLFL